MPLQQPSPVWKLGLVLTLALVSATGCKSKSDTPVSSPSETAGTDDVAKDTPQQPSETPPSTSNPTSDDTSTTSSGNSSVPDPSAPPSTDASNSAQATAANSEAKTNATAVKRDREILFKNWPQPKFVLLMTGQQIGYIEPCGCTGLTNQKGGLARRHTLAKQLAERGWPVVAVDVGNQVRRFGRQSEIKFQVTVDALKTIGYQAIAFGVDDLRLSVGELAAVTLPSDGGTTPFVSANAAILDRALTPTHHIVEVAGKKIGVTSILGTDLQSKIIGSEVILTSPEAGLDVVMPQLRNAKCDLLVLLAHTSIPESQELAKKYPDFKIVVTAGGYGEPTFQPEPITGTNSIMVQVGQKGMFVGVLGFYDDPQTPWRYQRVPLDDRFEDSAEMLAALASYQEQLKTLGLEGLGLKPLPHPTGNEFVGSEKCGECHSKAFAVWKEDTPHAHATESLVHPPERGNIARHFDPECLSCHVTGWNPQKYFPYTSGFLSLEKTPMQTASGCENCHGPGSSHVAAESGEGNPSTAMLAQLRASMRLRLSNAQSKCIECHDIDNSPDFHETGAFEKYWQRVEHKGLD